MDVGQVGWSPGGHRMEFSFLLRVDEGVTAYTRH